MTRLIDADELRQIAQYEDITLKDLDDAPTIDAVPTDFHDRCMQIEIDKRIDMCEACERIEVVRCRDCKLQVNCHIGHHAALDDYFCARGVREDD